MEPTDTSEEVRKDSTKIIVGRSSWEAGGQLVQENFRITPPYIYNQLSKYFKSR